MFKTILWATDGSPSADAALSFARELAAGEGKKLVAVHCKELMHGRAGGYPVRADEPDILAKIRRQVAEVREHGVDAELVVHATGAGSAAHLLADSATEIDADVIVAGTRGFAPVRGLLVGSVAQRLLHLAPCPVLVVGHEHAAATGTAAETVGAAY